MAMHSCACAWHHSTTMAMLWCACAIALICETVCAGSEQKLISSVAPTSMVLPAGTTQLELNVCTARSAACTWRVGSAVGTFDGDGKIQHRATVYGLVPDATILNNVTVQCSQCNGTAKGEETVIYRVLPDVSRAPFPRVGNLWGNMEGNFSRNLTYAASHVSLWMGVSRWGATEVGYLRRRNPYTVVLGSVNAVEDQGAVKAGPGAIPERFYLHNASGCFGDDAGNDDANCDGSDGCESGDPIRHPCGIADRLENWPGSYRLDLTRLEVQQYKADVMAQLMLRGGDWEGHPNDNTTSPDLLFDGLFVDNVFLKQWSMAASGGLRKRPFVPQHWENGTAWTSADAFDTAWRNGVLNSLRLFRAAAPHALLSGHSTDPRDPGQAGIFNGISIGFDVPLMVEGMKRIDVALSRAQDWFTLASVRSPRGVVTMVESAPPLQLGYGYGFNQNALANMPPSTRTFARTYFSNMRYGLVFALLSGASFAQELGDSYHGQDWWYDELDHSLGLPLGPSLWLPACSTPSNTMCTLVNASRMTINPSAMWSPSRVKLWVKAASGASAALRWDSAQRSPGSTSNASVRVDVLSPSSVSSASDVDVHITGVTFQQGERYSLRFWMYARVPIGADIDATVRLNARSTTDWRSYGLLSTVNGMANGTWIPFAANFSASLGSLNASANGAVHDAEISFWLGAVPAGTTLWIDRVELVHLPPPLIARQFECGLAVLSADGGGSSIGAGMGSTRTILLSRSDDWQRLLGSQAPRYQRVVDDLHPSFHPIKGSNPWQVAHIEHGYDSNRPTEELPTGPYYHTWAHSAHRCATGTGTRCAAQWSIPVDEPGEYTVSAWWPNATEAPWLWSSNARFSIVRHGSGTAGEFTSIVGAAVLDQRHRGDQWNVISKGVSLEPGDVLQLECVAPALGNNSGKLCIADALLLESAARFNDGSIANTVTLDPFDGIVLKRTNGKKC